ncbi:hypothetical protein O5D80_001244 [Batrachochytrium dendrobatidis]|nr:hypothetical protein O5D80_001244 [Batrachochytrium dendrobatidis]
MGNSQSVAKFITKTRQKKEKDISIRDIPLDPKWIPEDAGSLNLERLSLINASLPYLPDVIFQLKSLESLTVTGSDITSITGIGSLVRLKSLILHSNSIDWLPDDFYKLTELEELDLHNNRVSHRGIPPELFAMHNIRSIDFSGNKFTTLSIEFAKFGSKLREIKLHDNPWSQPELQPLSASLSSHDTRLILSSISGESNTCESIAALAAQSVTAHINKSSSSRIAFDPPQTALPVFVHNKEQEEATKEKKHIGGFFGRRSSDTHTFSQKSSISGSKPINSTTIDAPSKEPRPLRKQSKTVSPVSQKELNSTIDLSVERSEKPLALATRASGPRGRKPPSTNFIQKNATESPEISVESPVSLLSKSFTDSTQKLERAPVPLPSTRQQRAHTTNTQSTQSTSLVVTHPAKIDESESLHFATVPKPNQQSDLVRKNAIMHNHSSPNPTSKQETIQPRSETPSGAQPMESSKPKPMPKGGFNYMGGAESAANLVSAIKLTKTSSAIAMELNEGNASALQTGVQDTNAINPSRPPVPLPPKPAQRVRSIDAPSSQPCNDSSSQGSMPISSPKATLDQSIQPTVSLKNISLMSADNSLHGFEHGPALPKRVMKPNQALSPSTTRQYDTYSPPPVVAASPASRISPATSINTLANLSQTPEHSIIEGPPPPIKVSTKPSKVCAPSGMLHSPRNAENETVQDNESCVSKEGFQLLPTNGSCNTNEPRLLRINPADLKVRPRRAESANAYSTATSKHAKDNVMTESEPSPPNGISSPPQSSISELSQSPTASNMLTRGHQRHVSESVPYHGSSLENSNENNTQFKRSHGKEIVIAMDIRKAAQTDDLPIAPKLSTSSDLKSQNAIPLPKQSSVKTHASVNSSFSSSITPNNGNMTVEEPTTYLIGSILHDESLRESSELYESNIQQNTTRLFEKGDKMDENNHLGTTSSVPLTTTKQMLASKPKSIGFVATSNEATTVFLKNKESVGILDEPIQNTASLDRSGANKLSGISKSMNMLALEVVPPQPAPKPNRSIAPTLQPKAPQEDSSQNPKGISQAASARLALQEKLSQDQLCKPKISAISSDMLVCAAQPTNPPTFQETRAFTQSVDNLNSESPQRLPKPAYIATPGAAPAKPPKPRTALGGKSEQKEVSQQTTVQPSWKKQVPS